MKKIFTLIAGVMIAASASATTPYKALYAVAEVSPAGAGVVYLDAKNDEDKAYVKAQSEDYDETAFLQIVGAENGGGDALNQGDCQQGNGMYEALVYAEAEAGYEIVCLANQISESGVYTPSMCYAIHPKDTEESSSWSFTFDYSGIADGIRININNPNHAEDGNSNDDTPSRDAILNGEEYWSGNVDTQIYVICREEGASLPMFTTEEDPAGVNSVLAPMDEAATYNVAGQKVIAAKGIVIKNGKKYIVK